jgi:antitoxin (DNA-binding transcriptional repressor) of toxin-antitoxin stability system
VKSVKLSDAKNNLSRYVGYVRKGGRVRILLRDLPVADLVPVGGGSPLVADVDDELLTDLERRGLVRRGRGDAPASLLRPGPRADGRPLSEMVVDERRGGR